MHESRTHTVERNKRKRPGNQGMRKIRYREETSGDCVACEAQCVPLFRGEMKANGRA